MYKYILYTLLFLLSLASFELSAQKVGLVMSGGGAKGIAHIGVIKALEEYDIPIDYITGTSMGAIVGSMYAIGMSTDEMIELLKSNEFYTWSKGKIEKEHTHFYREAEPSPSILELGLLVKFSRQLDSLRVKVDLPSSVISPVQMNFVFFEIFSQATAASHRNFNNLFVPFRSVSTDVYRKEAVVSYDGDLGDAVRASMTFPFMFKPILINNRLLFDGGIVNNFPVDVMEKDFSPDFTIGSSVASNVSEPTANDPIRQLNAMIMNHTDYCIPEESGVLLQFEMKKESLFDFTKVDEFVDLGYRKTIEHMDEIKKHVSRCISQDSVKRRRQLFNENLPELKFKNVYIEGLDALKSQYVRSFFKGTRKEFDLEHVKRRYFELVEDERISEVIPHARYNEQEKCFDLHLFVKAKTNFKVTLGGNISSSTSNQAFVGVQFQDLGKVAGLLYLDAQFGSIYNALGFGTHIDIPSRKPLSLRADFVVHGIKNYSKSRVFYEEFTTSAFSQLESYGKLRTVVPANLKGRFDFGLGYGLLTDFYRQDGELKPSRKSYDRSYHSIFSLFSEYKASTFSHNKMYPVEGYQISASLKGLYGVESYRAVEYSSQNVSGIKKIWFSFRFDYQDYFKLSKKLTLGTHAELNITSRQLLHNYTTTIMQMPAFQPTIHSRVVFNEAFRAPQYAAFGIKPIVHLFSSCHLRNETYFFVPYQKVNRKADNSSVYSMPFSSYQYMTECSVVFNVLDVAAVSFFGNYYSNAYSKWNFGVNIGYLLFKDKFLK